ncbi:hypothetical protein HMPREF0290_0526 [Corynebacterium efficiens YS-314]|uniref:Uncharacterized protein n=1 Tax=Corynebacterium efficiens (strain DSM 44549 / YS-314 / AJ 12310 / JCM 11189 / NBRC 100395) TaxID=196164 RepID=Q8FTV1_COREF|nr:hypothetical protein HMPREF0290_0526 [Corynebacterium efficiens YS-314]BAC17087.1 hypothetical protein [Corynebacterium efficiens YS-314]
MAPVTVGPGLKTLETLQRSPPPWSRGLSRCEPDWGIALWAVLFRPPGHGVGCVHHRESPRVVGVIFKELMKIARWEV